MTVEEKKVKITDYCHSRDCVGCPLLHRPSCFTTSDDSVIEENYEILIKNGLIQGETPETPNKPKRLKGNPVEHPDHYNQGEIECIDAMIAAFGKEKVCDWCVMTSFKYHWRYQHKNGDEDICKASWYIDKYKELKELDT